MKRFVVAALLGLGAHGLVACDETSKNSEKQKSTATTKPGTDSSKNGGSSDQSASAGPVDLLPIPSGNRFVVSCTKTIKIPTNNNPIDARSDAGINAAIVLAELSQKGGVKICSEYWANTDDTEKASLIEDRTADCKTRETIVDAKLSLSTSCPSPQTGSSALSKSSEKIYFRSSVYISGATTEQLKKLSLGWSEIGMSSEGAETKMTENLR
jgi:hypothetical protein